MRITNNEEQIMNISRAMNKDYEKIPAINENLFNLSLKKDSKLIEHKKKAKETILTKFLKNLNSKMEFYLKNPIL